MPPDESWIWARTNDAAKLALRSVPIREASNPSWRPADGRTATRPRWLHGHGSPLRSGNTHCCIAWIGAGLMGRYRVDFPVDIAVGPGSSDDLEEAGRIYLNTPGATDIYDTQERRFVNPEVEIECVAEAFEKWHRETVPQNQEQQGQA